MENNTLPDQEFACEDCGFTSPITNDICPNCSGRMVGLDASPKAEHVGSDEDGEPGDSAFSDPDGGGALSLESLQEQETKDDYQDNYGNDSDE